MRADNETREQPQPQPQPQPQSTDQQSKEGEYKGLEIGYRYSRMDKDMRAKYTRLSVEERAEYNMLTRQKEKESDDELRRAIDMIDIRLGDLSNRMGTMGDIQATQSMVIADIGESVRQVMELSANIDSEVAEVARREDIREDPQHRQDDTQAVIAEVKSARNDIAKADEKSEDAEKRRVKEDDDGRNRLHTFAQAMKSYYSKAEKMIGDIVGSIPQLWVALATIARAFEDVVINRMIPAVKEYLDPIIVPLKKLLRVGDEGKEEQARIDEQVETSKYINYQQDEIDSNNAKADSVDDSTLWGKAKKFWYRTRAIKADSDQMNMAIAMGYSKPFVKARGNQSTSSTRTTATQQSSNMINDVKMQDPIPVSRVGDIVERTTEVHVHNNTTNNSQVVSVNSSDSPNRYR